MFNGAGSISNQFLKCITKWIFFPVKSNCSTNMNPPKITEQYFSV